MSDEPDRADVPGEQGQVDLPLTSAYLFARQLQWRLELYPDAKWVVIQLAHTSHKKGGGILGSTLHPPDKNRRRGRDPFTLAYIFGWSDIRMAMRYTHATNANMRQAVRSLDSLSVRLGNVLATKTKTAGAVPP